MLHFIKPPNKPQNASKQLTVAFVDCYVWLSFFFLFQAVHDSNTLFGIISPQIGNISNLKFLDLGNNELFGVIPPEIGLLTHIKHLYIDVNKLCSLVPWEVGQLSSLKQVASLML